MAKRRFQHPTPFVEGKWWWILVRKDVLEEGKLKRKQERIKLGPASMLKREALKIASEKLRPMNQGLELVGSVTQVKDYVENTYKKVELPLLAKSTQLSYQSHIDRYILPKWSPTRIRACLPLSPTRTCADAGIENRIASMPTKAMFSQLRAAPYRIISL